MYELIIRILNDNDLKKYTIKELHEMKAILELYKDLTLEVELHRIKEGEKKL